MSAAARGSTIFDGTATVARVVALGNGTDWATLSVADEQGELITMVGTSLGKYAEPGRRLHVVGRWRQHPRHGLQVNVTRVEPVFAGAVEGDPGGFLERAPHVGPKRAQLLLDLFGDDAALARIDEDPGKAFRQLGMPGHHVAAAVRWWRSRR